jgi:hypothetical protein
MRRLMMLVTVVVLMTAMLVVTTAPALAIPGPPARAVSSGGTPLPAVVCESPAAASPNIGWSNETCWVFHPVPVSNI